MLHIPELEPNEQDLQDLEDYRYEKLFAQREHLLKDLKTLDF